MKNVGTQKLQSRMNTLDIVYAAIGVALITVCSWISVPLTVPFTLQTFAVFTVLLLLGGQRGTVSILVYVLAGSAGLPVFSGFAGGAGVIFGKTGGYIIGFLFTGLIYMAFTKIFGKKAPVEITALLLGLTVCYAFGTAWFMFIYMRDTGPVGLFAVLSWCVFPFVIPDLVKMAMAFVISKRLRQSVFTSGGIDH